MSHIARAPQLKYTVTVSLIVRGTPREHVAARNLWYEDASALVDAYIDSGYDVTMTPQPTTPFVAIESQR